MRAVRATWETSCVTASNCRKRCSSARAAKPPEQNLLHPHPHHHVRKHQHRIQPLSRRAGIDFREDLKLLNLEPVPARTSLVRYAATAPTIQVIDNRNITERHLNFTNGRILTRVSMIPPMFTSNTKIIKQDYLGYVMETT